MKYICIVQVSTQMSLVTRKVMVGSVELCICTVSLVLIIVDILTCVVGTPC